MIIKKIDHFVITTKQLDSCLSFYESLGFEIRKGEHFGEIFANEFKINVHVLHQERLPHALNVQIGCNDFCFEIDTPIDELKEYLIAKSIEIELGIVERYGHRGAMKSIYIRDPDGNLLEFSNYQ